MKKKMTFTMRKSGRNNSGKQGKCIYICTSACWWPRPQSPGTQSFAQWLVSSRQKKSSPAGEEKNHIIGF